MRTAHILHAGYALLLLFIINFEGRKMERDLYFIDRNILGNLKKKDYLSSKIKQLTNDMFDINRCISTSFVSILPVLKEARFGRLPSKQEYESYCNEVFNYLFYYLGMIDDYKNNESMFSLEKEDINNYLKIEKFQHSEILLDPNPSKFYRAWVEDFDEDKATYSLLSEFHKDYSQLNKNQRKDELNRLFSYVTDNNISKKNIALITIILAICGNSCASGILYHNNKGKINTPWNAYSDLSIFNLLHFAHSINETISKLNKTRDKFDEILPFKKMLIVTDDQKLFDYYKMLYQNIIDKEDNKIIIKQFTEQNLFTFPDSLLEKNKESFVEINNFLNS